MARQAPGYQEQRVNPDVIAFAGIARGKPLRGNGDAAETIFVERPSGGFLAAPLFYLDKGKSAAATGNQVDFTARDTRSLRKNPPTVQPQPPGGNGLSLASTLLGKLPA